MLVSEVYNEDCVTGMRRYPDGFFDLAIVDPPYGLGLDMINRNGLQESMYANKDWNNIIPGADYFEALYRVSKHQIIWGANYYMPYIQAIGMIIHDKMAHFEGTKINFSHADLASCSLQKRTTMFRYKWAGNNQGATVNWRNVGLDGRIHPTQKPIALYRHCMQYAKSGWKILDTHMGSQSSRIAANQMKLDYYGWEIDPEYFEAGNKRYHEQTKQLRMWADDPDLYFTGE